MSLTGELKDKHSRVRQWMNRYTNRAGITSLDKEANDILSTQTLLAPPEGSTSKDRRLVGTAFDYAFRWRLGPLIADNNLAAMAGTNFGSTDDWVMTMPHVVHAIVDGGNATTDLVRQVQSSVILAWFEQNAHARFRGPVPALENLADPAARIDSEEYWLGSRSYHFDLQYTLFKSTYDRY